MRPLNVKDMMNKKKKGTDVPDKDVASPTEVGESLDTSDESLQEWGSAEESHDVDMTDVSDEPVFGDADAVDVDDSYTPYELEDIASNRQTDEFMRRQNIMTKSIFGVSGVAVASAITVASFLFFSDIPSKVLANKEAPTPIVQMAPEDVVPEGAVPQKESEIVVSDPDDEGVETPSGEPHDETVTLIDVTPDGSYELPEHLQNHPYIDELKGLIDDVAGSQLGSEHTIRIRDTSQVAGVPVTPAPSNPAQPNVQETQQATPQQVAPASPNRLTLTRDVPGYDYKYYVVEEGDTLYELSQVFNVPMGQLMELNQIYNADVIYVGQVLLFPQDTVQPNY